LLSSSVLPRAADAIPPPQQFAANPGFESELHTPLLAPWSCEPGTASVKPSVDESPRLVGTPTPTSTAMCAQDVPVQPNGTYDLYADVRGGDVAVGSEFGTAWAAPSQQWTRLGIRFTVGPETSLVRGSSCMDGPEERRFPWTTSSSPGRRAECARRPRPPT
jgi:hypothetical protein